MPCSLARILHLLGGGVLEDLCRVKGDDVAVGVGHGGRADGDRRSLARLETWIIVLELEGVTLWTHHVASDVRAWSGEPRLGEAATAEAMTAKTARTENCILLEVCVNRGRVC